MSQPTKVEEVVKRTLTEEAQTDVVGLWAVLWQVREELPSLTPSEAKRLTLQVIREAMAEERIVPGSFADGPDTAAFVPWQLSVDDAVKRIDAEWQALGRDPNLGEIVWFAAPRLLPAVFQKEPMGKGWRP